MNVVKVTIRSVYGNERIYPANETAQKFADLACQVTLRRSDIEIIKSLGFTVEVVPVTL